MVLQPMIKRLLWLALIAAALPAMGQVFNCSSGWSSSGSCSFQNGFNQSGINFGANSGTITSTNQPSAILQMDRNAMHGSTQIWYDTAVNVQAFTASFTFQPSDLGNFAFVFNNCTFSCGSGSGPSYSAGAGCEAGYYQAFSTPAPGPNNVFALQLDLYSPLTNGGSFTYSSVQLYQSLQSPCLPNDSGPYYYPTTKLSTSPVNLTSGTQGIPLNHVNFTSYSVSGTTMTLQGTNSYISGQSISLTAPNGDGLVPCSGNNFTVLPTGLSSSQIEITESCVTGSGSTSAIAGDKFSVITTYAGNTLNLCLADGTAGNACTSATGGTGTVFTQTFNGVYIPAIVGGTTAYVGFTTGIGLTTSDPLYVNGFEYTVNSTSAGSGLTAYNANSTYNNGTVSVASPTYSVAPGSYSGTQSVTISDSTSSSYICYTTSSSYPTLTPQPDNKGGCNAGTLYTGAVSIPSTTTLYAMGGIAVNASQSAGGNPPSTLVAGTYTINPLASTTVVLGGKQVFAGKVIIQ
jgi:hypothetical protein